MELTIKQEEGYVVASTSGSIDASADQPFRDQLHANVLNVTKLVNFLTTAESIEDAVRILSED